MFPVWPIPKPSGQYAVGVRTFEISDASRKGIFAAKPDEPRRLLVRVWYPAGDAAGLKPAPDFNAAESEEHGRVHRRGRRPAVLLHVSQSRADQFYADAPLLPGSPPTFQTVIYSHGYTSYLNQNTALMEDWASHGYVAFSIQHTYDSAAHRLPKWRCRADGPRTPRGGRRRTRPAVAEGSAGRRDARQAFRRRSRVSGMTQSSTAPASPSQAGKPG